MQLNKGAARGLVTLVTAGLLAGGLVGSAHAAVPAKAVISATDVLAGSTAAITVTVSNPASGPTASKNPSINVVRVLPPITSAGVPTATLPSATEPSGWTKAQTPDRKGWKFTVNAAASSPTSGTPLSTAPGIADGAKADFIINTTFLPQSADAIGNWRVQTSTDGGATYDDAGAPGTALAQTVHVLSISGVTLDLKRAGKATQGQANRKLSFTVTNVGTKDATVGLGANNANGDGIPTSAPVLVAAGGSYTFQGFPTFGSAAAAARGLTVTASGTTPDGVASAVPSTTTSYTVQKPATFTCTALSPNPISGSASIVPKVDITPAADPGSATTPSIVEGATLSTQSLLDLGAGVTTGPANLVTPLTTGIAKITAVPFARSTTSQPGADQNYPVTFRAVGEDLNGAPIDSSTPCGQLTVDVTASIATVSVTTPQKAPGAPGEKPGATTGSYVAKNNDTVTFGISVKDGSTADPKATLVCNVLQYQGATVVATTPISPCTNTTGSLTLTPKLTYTIGVDSARLQVDVTDAAGNPSTSYSPTYLVDNTAPVFVEHESKTTSPKTISLKLSELTVLSGNVLDYTVDLGGTRYLVESVGLSTGDGNFGTSLTLNLRNALPEDATPTVTLAPLTGSPKPVDGAGNALAAPIRVEDGIAPGTPSVVSVDGKGEQLGSYYTNSTQPLLTITGVSDQHAVTVYEDENGNGRVDAGESSLCTTINSSGLSEVICKLLTRTEGDHALLLVARDPSGNLSVTPGTARVVVDKTNVQIVGFQVVGNTIVVSFSEIVTGRNAPDDWYIVNAANATAFPTSVAVDSTGLKRTLTFGAGDRPIYTTADTVVYDYQGPAGDAYTDLAGNTVTALSYTTRPAV